jgi:hypothetical protein
MEAFIKDDKLIVNTMILDNEKDELLEYIKKAESRVIKPIKLYDVLGNISGVAFEIK